MIAVRKKFGFFWGKGTVSPKKSFSFVEKVENVFFLCKFIKKNLLFMLIFFNKELTFYVLIKCREFCKFTVMNFVKTTLHFQNSSKSVTLQLPAFFFCWPVIRVVLVIGILLFVVQILTTTLYSGLLYNALSGRQKLNDELAQIENTLGYMTQTAGDFLKAEQMLQAKYGLPIVDEEDRELATGGLVSPEVNLLRKAAPVFERAARLREGAKQVQGKIANNASSFKSLTKYIDQSLSQWRFYPSISPTQGRYASAFGPRVHPVTGEVGKMHQGIDIGNDRWTPIFAPADGVVEISQPSTTFGNFVVLNHGNGIKTRYGHMQMSVVKPGFFVHRYQILGYMGNTGRSVGPHLHYEVWVNGNPVNPLPYILPNDHVVD